MKKTSLILAMAALAALPLFADFATDYAKANQILVGNPKEAQTILEKLLTENLIPKQKDQVLSDLAYTAQRLKQFDKAGKYIEQIGEKPVQAYARMRLLNSQPGKTAQFIELFGDEDISKWPEDLAHLGYRQRAYAWYLTGKNAEALADAQKCLEGCGSDQETRLVALQLAGSVAQRMKDNKKALEFYEQVLPFKNARGSASYLLSALEAVNIYIAEKRFQDAEKTLSVIQKTHAGHYASLVYAAYGDLYAAQGKNPEAAEYYRKCIDEKNGFAAARKAAKEKLEKLGAAK